MGMTRNIDNGNTGLVNWRQFLTYLTLGNSPLPTVNKLNEAKMSAGGKDVVTKSQFVSVSYNVFFTHTMFRLTSGSMTTKPPRTVSTRSRLTVPA